MNNGPVGQPVAGTSQNTLKRPWSWPSVHMGDRRFRTRPCLFCLFLPPLRLTGLWPLP